MAVCERPGFWRWLAQGFVGTIGAGLGGIGYIFTHIRDPSCEMVIGGTVAFLFALVAVLDSVDSEPYLTLTTRVILAIIAVPSFLIMMHGVYRMGDDC